MKITEVKNIDKYLLPSRVIGLGTTAICFKMKDGNVLKHYVDTYNKRRLFNGKDMLPFLKNISCLSNDTYIAPKEILVKDKEVIGYIYPYVKAKTLHSSIRNIKIFDILNHYKELLTDTREISNKHFRLGDLHDRNILYNGRLRVIDLDLGDFTDYDSYNLFLFNMNSLMKAYMYEIFRVKDYQILGFINRKLDNVYSNTLWNEANSVYDLLEHIAKETHKSNPTISEVRRNVGITKKINTYYNFFR